MSGPSKVIVLDPDARAARQLAYGFQREGVAAVIGDVARIEPPSDLGIAIVGVRDDHAADLIRRTRAALDAGNLDVPIVAAVHPGANGLGQEEAEEAGADEVVPGPSHLRDVVTVGRILAGAPAGRRDHVVGSLAETSGVFTLVRALARLGRSAVLTLIRGLRRGEVRFYHGEVTSAQVGLIHGQAALHQLLLWTDARFDYHHEDIVRRQQIPLPSPELFADAQRFLEGVRDSAGRLSPAMVLEQDVARVHQVGKHIPTEVHGVLRMFDGHRVLADVLEDSPYRVFETLRVAQRALEAGLLRITASTRPKATWRPVLAIEEWLTGGDGDGTVSGFASSADSEPIRASADATQPLRPKVPRKKRRKRRANTPLKVPQVNATTAATTDIDWGQLVPRVVGAEVGPLSGVVPVMTASGEIPLRDIPRVGVEEDGPKVVIGEDTDKAAVEAKAEAEARAKAEAEAAAKAEAMAKAEAAARAEADAAEKAAAEAAAKAEAEAAEAKQRAEAEAAANAAEVAAEAAAAKAQIAAEVAAKAQIAAEASARAAADAEAKAAADAEAKAAADAEAKAAADAEAKVATEAEAKAAADAKAMAEADAARAAAEADARARAGATPAAAAATAVPEPTLLTTPPDIDAGWTTPTSVRARQILAAGDGASRLARELLANNATTTETTTPPVTIVETPAMTVSVAERVTVVAAADTAVVTSAQAIIVSETVAAGVGTAPTPSSVPEARAEPDISDGVVRRVPTGETAPMTRARRPSSRPDPAPVELPGDTSGEIAHRSVPVRVPDAVGEPSILVADLAAAQQAIAAVATAQAAQPATPNAATPAHEAAVSDLRKDVHTTFSDAEEAFFKASQDQHDTAPRMPPVESFDDLDEDYQPATFWDRLLGRKPAKKRAAKRETKTPKPK
jgi:hypothetical protein